MPNPKAVDLFCGLGGWTEGLLAEGYGVVGFDNAHKAAADVAETDFFISIDGDNIIDEKFLLETLDWSKTDRKAVHRWRAKNSINGLVYGNGGIVGWDKQTCKLMKTHEKADTCLLYKYPSPRD